MEEYIVIYKYNRCPIVRICERDKNYQLPIILL